MKSTKPATAGVQHLLKAHELVKEDARLSRYEWEEALDNNQEAQRVEAEARDKYLALTATVQLLEASTSGTQTPVGGAHGAVQSATHTATEGAGHTRPTKGPGG